MLGDARGLPPGSTLDCDVCIVGAGAAGISLALELQGTGFKTILLESGGKREDKRARNLSVGEISDPVHHGPLHQYRARCLGGTTTLWGGCCAPFDELDFEPRQHVAFSGWPFRKEHLDPYYERAHVYCELGAYEYNVDAAISGVPPPMIQGLTSPDLSTDKVWRYSPPTDFGKAYRSRLRRSSNVHVYTHASVLGLLVDQSRRVELVKAASVPGREFFVRARHVVLATGGLEAARLLLLSDDVHPHGIGNERGNVGRYYLSHLSGDVGTLDIAPPNRGVVGNYERTVDGVYCRRRLSINAERQTKEGLLNFGAVLDRPDPADPGHRSAVLSALYLSRQGLRSQPPAGDPQIRRHVANLISDGANLLRFGATLGSKRILSKRRLPSVVVPGRRNLYALHFDAEQAPDPRSTVGLSEARDAFGLRRLRIDWRFSEQDVDSVVRSARIIDRTLRDCGVGSLRLGEEAMRDRVREMASVGSHHMGTTRMSRDPATGVVDQDCRVHGIANLFIASSSVFPTGSFARPTLTIVALAVRLADHLRRAFDVRS